MDLESIDLVTQQELFKALPKGMSKSIPNGLVDKVNEIIQADDITRQGFRDNVIGFTSVLQEGRWSIKDYLNAVKFCTYRLSGKGVGDSYGLTFPDRYEKLVAEGATQKYISSITTQYNKSKIVSVIMEQALVPTHILNQDLFQKAVNTQAELMNSANSEKVRCDAANSLLTHLKPPEKSKIELDVTVNEGGVVEELKDTLQKLASKQLSHINQGHSNVKDIAESQILGAGVVEGG